MTDVDYAKTKEWPGKHPLQESGWYAKPIGADKPIWGQGETGEGGGGAAEKRNTTITMDVENQEAALEKSKAHRSELLLELHAPPYSANGTAIIEAPSPAAAATATPRLTARFGWDCCESRCRVPQVCYTQEKRGPFVPGWDHVDNFKLANGPACPNATVNHVTNKLDRSSSAPKRFSSKPYRLSVFMARISLAEMKCEFYHDMEFFVRHLFAIYDEFGVGLGLSAVGSFPPTESIGIIGGDYLKKLVRCGMARALLSAIGTIESVDEPTCFPNGYIETNLSPTKPRYTITPYYSYPNDPVSEGNVGALRGLRAVVLSRLAKWPMSRIAPEGGGNSKEHCVRWDPIDPHYHLFMNWAVNAGLAYISWESSKIPDESLWMKTKKGGDRRGDWKHIAPLRTT